MEYHLSPSITKLPCDLETCTCLPDSTWGCKAVCHEAVQVRWRKLHWRRLRWRKLPDETQFPVQAAIYGPIAEVRRERRHDSKCTPGNTALNTMQCQGMAATSTFDHKSYDCSNPPRQTSLGFLQLTCKATARYWSDKTRTWGHKAECHADSGRPLTARPLLAAVNMQLGARRLGG